MSENKDVAEERIYTIPLRDVWRSPVKKRVPRAIRIIRAFLMRHTKPDELKISPEVNEYMWRRGIEHLPRRIRVRVIRDSDNVVRVYLAQGE